MPPTELKGSRLLRKMIPGAEFAPDSEGTWAQTTDSEGWTIVENDLDDAYAVWKGYFDVVGLSSQELSMLVGNPAWQESDEWHLSVLAPGPRPVIRTWDILSKSHLDDSMLDSRFWINVSIPTGWSPPGMIDSNYNLEEIFMGRYRSFVINSTYSGGNALGQTGEQVWGAGDATAGDKIHITRVVLLEDTQAYPGGILQLPPMAVVVPLGLISEPDLVHMERLRRSYVHADVRG